MSIITQTMFYMHNIYVDIFACHKLWFIYRMRWRWYHTSEIKCFSGSTNIQKHAWMIMTYWNIDSLKHSLSQVKKYLINIQNCPNKWQVIHGWLLKDNSSNIMCTASRRLIWAKITNILWWIIIHYRIHNIT